MRDPFRIAVETLSPGNLVNFYIARIGRDHLLSLPLGNTLFFQYEQSQAMSATITANPKFSIGRIPNGAAVAPLASIGGAVAAERATAANGVPIPRPQAGGPDHPAIAATDRNVSQGPFPASPAPWLTMVPAHSCVRHIG